MTDEPEDNFLRRWSRRKQAARSPAREVPPAQADAEPSPSTAPREAARPAFDPASLPPVESITALSDIRAFLAPGVPGEIVRAALRRAWVTDPAIRDFVGLAENQWDFTKPDGVPGFGTLDPTPELRRMAEDLFRSAAGIDPTPAETVRMIGNHAEVISGLRPATGDKLVSSGDTPSKMPACVDHARVPGNMPAQAAAGPDPAGLADGTANPAPQRDGGLPARRRRHGRAVPE